MNKGLRENGSGVRDNTARMAITHVDNEANKQEWNRYKFLLKTLHCMAEIAGYRIDAMEMKDTKSGKNYKYERQNN